MVIINVFRISLLVGLSLLLVHCGEVQRDALVESSLLEDNNGSNNESGNEFQPVEEGGNSQVFEGDYICYSSDQSCFSIFSKLEITEPSDYNYKNPAGSFSASVAPQYRQPQYFIDLHQSSNPSGISEHFATSEYMADYKGRYGLMSPLVTNRLQSMRMQIGLPIKVNSAFRSPAYNDSIDGATWSRHMYGDAVDIAVNGLTPSQVKEYCEAQGASYIQVYVSHVHCDWRYEELSEEFYGPKITQALTKTMLKLETHVHTDSQISIVQHGEGTLGSRLEFNIDAKEKEEGGDLLVEWEVTFNGEPVLELSAPKLILSDLKQGEYQITATVGGYWVKVKAIEVP